MGRDDELDAGEDPLQRLANAGLPLGLQVQVDLVDENDASNVHLNRSVASQPEEISHRSLPGGLLEHVPQETARQGKDRSEPSLTAESPISCPPGVFKVTPSESTPLTRKGGSLGRSASTTFRKV